MFKKSLSLLLALTMVLSLGVTAFAAELTTAGGDGETPITLSTEAAMFSVTVPTVLPIYVDADGAVTCAQSGVAKIINNGHGVVKVTNLEIAGKNSWKTTDYDSANMVDIRVNTKLFAFTINNEKTTGTNAITFNEANFPILDGANDTDSDELVINYNAIVAPQSSALSDTNIADVVFTIGWDVNPYTSLPSMGKSAEEYTWDEITEISKANKGDEFFDIGDTKTITTSDGKSIVMEIAAFNTDKKADGSGKAGITWVAKYGIGLHAMTNTGSNTGGWAKSYMRSWLQEDVYSTLPTELQEIIVPVTKTYAMTRGNAGPGYSTSSCVDTLWIPSTGEVFGSGEAGAVVYPYFEDTANRKRTFGSTAYWWTRTAYSDANYRIVTPTGDVSNSNGGYEYIVVLGFCT